MYYLCGPFLQFVMLVCAHVCYVIRGAKCIHPIREREIICCVYSVVHCIRISLSLTFDVASILYKTSYMKYYNLLYVLTCRACVPRARLEILFFWWKLKAKSQFKVSNSNYDKPKKAHVYICAPKL